MTRPPIPRTVAVRPVDPPGTPYASDDAHHAAAMAWGRANGYQPHEMRAARAALLDHPRATHAAVRGDGSIRLTSED